MSEKARSMRKPPPALFQRNSSSALRSSSPTSSAPLGLALRNCPETASRPRAALRVVRLGLGQHLGGERFILSGNAVVGRALEDGELFGLFRDDRDHLDAARTGSDQGDTLASEVHPFAGPLRAVIPLAGEGGEVLQIGLLGD